MKTRWPSAVSCLYGHQHHARLQLTPALRSARAYASSTNPSPSDVDRPEKAALVEVTGLRRIDPVNPPRSTLPAELLLPVKGSDNVALYYFRIGRAYGSFYMRGIKAVWFNNKATQALRERMKKKAQLESDKSIPQSVWLDRLSRAEFQLLARNSYDIGKLPFFGLLVLIFGEWLPLLVPFIPGAVPGTCRIPKQIRGMRVKAEERRKISFRRGIKEPSEEQVTVSSKELTQEDWPMAEKDHVAAVLQRFRNDQLLHLSCTLNRHNSLWDRVQLPPPSALLRLSLSKRLAYLASDDKLLNRDGGATKLSPDEVAMACEERGLDVLGKREETLRNSLAWWLARQKEDKGQGFALFTMLFRRPNAWDTLVAKSK